MEIKKNVVTPRCLEDIASTECFGTWRVSLGSEVMAGDDISLSPSRIL